MHTHSSPPPSQAATSGLGGGQDMLHAGGLVLPWFFRQPASVFPRGLLPAGLHCLPTPMAQAGFSITCSLFHSLFFFLLIFEGVEGKTRDPSHSGSSHTCSWNP